MRRSMTAQGITVALSVVLVGSPTGTAARTRYEVALAYTGITGHHVHNAGGCQAAEPGSTPGPAPSPRRSRSWAAAAAEMATIRTEYPDGDDGGGGSPNGQPIEDRFSPDTMFAPGGLARLRVGYYPLDPRPRGWALRAIRRIP